jgi:GTP cyclohydrolase I
METIDSATKNNQYKMTWQEARERTYNISQIFMANHGAGKIWGIPKGGQYVAAMLPDHAVETWEQADFLVDDIVDSGQTKKKWEAKTGRQVLALVNKQDDPEDAKLGWVVFPWEIENKGAPEDSIVRLLEYVGENPKREGLLETPKRVLKAYREMTAGYYEELDFKVFNLQSDEMVILRGIRFASLCEHHLLPFSGTAAIAYIPDPARLLGISKLARVVTHFARRLQCQENLTNQIANYLQDCPALAPKGVGVLIRAHHNCMGCRGVNQPDAELITSALRGCFMQSEVRAEFLGLL